MTQEERNGFKDLKKYLEEKAKLTAKEYGIKKKDYIFYISRNNMFYSLMFHMTENGLKVVFYAKPLWMDDILWDILGMSENRNQPVSLRGIGAFTIASKIREAVLLVDNEDSIDSVVRDVFMDFMLMVESYNESDYLEQVGQIKYQNEMIRTIIYIHNKEYERALDYLSETNIMSFQVSEKSFTELAKEYIGKVGR